MIQIVIQCQPINWDNNIDQFWNYTLAYCTRTKKGSLSIIGDAGTERVNVSITQWCPFSRRKLVSLTGINAREIARRRTYYARLRWLFSLMYSRRWPGRVINTEKSTDIPLRSSRWATGKAMTPGPSRDPKNGPRFLRAHTMSKRVDQHGLLISFPSFCVLHRRRANSANGILKDFIGSRDTLALTESKIQSINSDFK